MLRRFAGSVRRNAVGYAALFIALGGTSAYALENTVGSDEIINNSVRSIDIEDYNPFAPVDGPATGIQREDLAPGVIGQQQIFDEAVAGTKIASTAVTAAKLADGAVTQSKLGAGAVDGEKIADFAVGAADLAPESVITSRIANRAVTADKLAEGAISGDALGMTVAMKPPKQSNCKKDARGRENCTYGGVATCPPQTIAVDGGVWGGSGEPKGAASQGFPVPTGFGYQDPIQNLPPTFEPGGWRANWKGPQQTYGFIYAFCM